jgi:hypothetical protein
VTNAAELGSDVLCCVFVARGESVVVRCVDVDKYDNSARTTATGTKDKRINRQ